MRLSARPLIRPSGTFSREGEKGGAERHVLAEPSLHIAGMSAHLPRSAFSMHFKVIDAVCVAGTGQPWIKSGDDAECVARLSSS